MKDLSSRKWFRVYLFFLWGLSFVEAVLVAFKPVGTLFTAQVVVLAASSLLFVFGNTYIVTFVIGKGLSLFEAILALITPGETKLEFACFIIGWACIFDHPGLASLRIFRVVRVLWYLELKQGQEGRWFSAVQKGGGLVIKYLERIGGELFSTNTRGGTVVLSIYFYTVYVFAVVYWNEVGKYNASNTSWFNPNTNQYPCNTLNNCFITLMRLSLYDGNGFDFISNLSESHAYRALAALLILYMCFTAITLLNGLIGIFAAAFTADSGDDDDDEKEKDKDDKDKDDDKEPKEEDGDNEKK